MYNFLELKFLTQHLFRYALTFVTWSVSTTCVRTKAKAQWDRRNV